MMVVIGELAAVGDCCCCCCFQRSRRRDDDDDIIIIIINISRKKPFVRGGKKLCG
jgi:hypothetical protein